MKPTFHCRVVNGPFDDPVVYVRIIRLGKALLFDLGDIWALNAREIHKIAHVFVTHTHIDHFIGFDRLLRILLRRQWPLNLYGPSGIIESVRGRLAGYTWNLIEEYPLEFYVTEVKEGFIKTVRFSAREWFMPVEIQERENASVIYNDALFYVRTGILDHGIPVLAYSLQEKEHLNIDPERLKSLGLPVGPWLSELKEMIRLKKLDESIKVTGKQQGVVVKEMIEHGVVRKTPGQKISYVMDVAPTDENLNRIRELVSGSDLLFIETYFLEEDAERAAERNHLTAAVAGRVAAEALVKKVIPLHISPKYKGRQDEVIKETMRHFESFRH